eukprot:g10763.t1
MSEVFGRHPSAAGRRTPNIGSEGQQQWVPRSARAYTAADHASVANAREHHANLVYEVVFPQPGALGLNLRSYFVQNSAGARLGLPEYGSLVVLDCQNAWLTTVVHSGDLLISINGEKLTGTNFSFAESISMCSRAPLPRVFRFARLGGDASSAEIELALTGDICAVFDAVDTPQKRLVTAQLHPSAPPFFYLNAPTRQPVYNGYSFWFASEENKAKFEAQPLAYIPAWGGFCSWGIAGETWWTRDNLGPQADPELWLITDEGRLHFFRSPTPMSKFMVDVEASVIAGDGVWNEWWGEALPGAGGVGGTPLNTNCFCSPETCEDA